RALVGRLLPDYMVPGWFVELAALPLTGSGKLDRAALPEPEHRRAVAGFVAARTVTEELLAGIWAGVLGVGGIGAGDNFFELGGHLLLSTQGISRIRETFQVEFPLGALFAHPTVTGLAEVIDHPTAGVTVPAITPLDRGQALPLSFAQQRLWFLDQLEPGSTEYNTRLALRLRGVLDAAAFAAALDDIVARHEVL